MGGNALSMQSVRLTKSNYNQLAGEVVSALTALYPHNRVSVIKAYRDKADFGDLDVLVESTGYNPFDAAKALNATEVVRNGPVTSIGVVVRPELGAIDGNVFQVDLVSQEPDGFAYADAYFSFNDLGNLIGRTAHKMGVAHCHDGLFYYFRDGDHLFRKLCLTRNHDEALRFLGYDPAVFHAGFDDLQGIFDYVTGSTYFNREIFLLENRNYASRIRDRKRKTYTSFLAHCDAHPELPAYPYPADKSEWLPLIMAAFPGFRAEYDQAAADLAELRAVKVRFNGELVSGWTGLQGKELGAVMRHFREAFPDTKALNAYVLSADEADLKSRVLACQAEVFPCAN